MGGGIHLPDLQPAILGGGKNEFIPHHVQQIEIGGHIGTAQIHVADDPAFLVVPGIADLHCPIVIIGDLHEPPREGEGGQIGKQIIPPLGRIHAHEIDTSIGRVHGKDIPGVVHHQNLALVARRRHHKVTAHPQVPVLEMGPLVFKVGGVQYPGGGGLPILVEGEPGAFVQGHHVFSPVPVEFIVDVAAVLLREIRHDQGPGPGIQLHIHRGGAIVHLIDLVEDILTGEDIEIIVKKIIVLQPPQDIEARIVPGGGPGQGLPA